MIQGTDNINDLACSRDAWARYLNTFQWDWFITLTFSRKVSTRLAFKKFNDWKVQIKKAVGHKVYYFMVIEKGKFKGDNVHLHVFMNGVAYENPNKWIKKWNSLAGISDIKPYNKTQGANYYISDKIVFKEQDILFSKDIHEIAPVNAI